MLLDKLVSYGDKIRFWEKVKIREHEQCWNWVAHKRNGYGMFQIWNRSHSAHRLCWIMEFGPIPDGLCVLHSCDNPSCCNPEHLFLGTHTDNMRDASRKGKFHRKGELNGRAKLTEREVATIRNLHGKGGLTPTVLAKAFGVTRPAISQILRREHWTHLS